jgi:hypothetical protein
LELDRQDREERRQYRQKLMGMNRAERDAYNLQLAEWSSNDGSSQT